MEHLPLPSSATAHLRVPCFSDAQYDNGPFSSFPARHNWKIVGFKQCIKEAFLCCGQVPTLQETQAFLQTWLYFGTIHEVFGDSVPASDFIATDELGNKYLSTANLNPAWRNLVGRSGDASADKTVQYEACLGLCNRIQSHLDTLYYELSSVAEVADLASTATATGLLGEAFEHIVRDVRRRVLSVETPPEMLWGTASSRWALDHLKSAGWCPSTITRLASDRPLLSLLYYYCHLPPPSKAFDHSMCTKNTCLALQINPDTYSTTHTTNSCDCADLNLEVEEIGRVLNYGRLPLIEVPIDGEPTSAKLRLRQDDGHVGFVAISHVWADGLGNVRNNSLPACSLHDVSRMISQLPGSSSQEVGRTPFWIDTVCVPVEPAAMKQLALTKLRDPYMRAKYVLVLDNYLRTVNANDCDALEILVRLLCCNWVGRLWTLQESRLAKKAWFQFKDKAVTLEAIWEEVIGTQLWQRNGAFWRSMFADALVKGARQQGKDLNSGENSIRLFNDAGGHLLDHLRFALRFRSVSMSADEALCLFCLADLRMEDVTSVPAFAPLRMKVFWSQMETVPSGLLFSKCPRKLDEPGFRWAPLSLMGALPRNHWAGSAAVDHDSNGKPTPRGLLAKFSGFVISVDWDEIHDLGSIFFRSTGDWLRLYLQRPWNATSPSIPSGARQRMAIILMKPLRGQANRYPKGEPDNLTWSDHTYGIIGHLTGEDDNGIKYVRGLRHVTAYTREPLEQFIFDAALDCISAKGLDIEHSLDLQERALRMANACFEKHPLVASACQEWIIGTPYATAQDRFKTLIMQIAEPVKFYGGLAETVLDQQWCVD